MYGKMKYLYVLLIMVLAVIAEKHENLDIDGLLSDPKNFQNIVSCFLDKAPCDDIAASFKTDLPRVIESACSKCTPNQKHIVKVFIDAFNQAPTTYEVFKDKYDPERINIANLEAAVARF